MEKEKSYISGIIGGIIGGCIAAIPWVVIYVYGSMILSILATLVAFAVISIIVITVATFFVIPALELSNEGYVVDSYNFKLLYSSSEFVDAIAKDYVISLIFTILGISGVIANLRKKFQPQNQMQYTNHNLNQQQNINQNLNQSQNINIAQQQNPNKNSKM